MARLRGGLRRLNVVDPDEYDEQEYTEAATAVFQAAQVIASQSRQVLTANLDSIRAHLRYELILGDSTCLRQIAHCGIVCHDKASYAGAVALMVVRVC